MRVKETQIVKLVEEKLGKIDHVGMQDELIKRELISDFVKGIQGNNQVITVKHPFTDIQPLLIETYIQVKHVIDNEERKLMHEEENKELEKMSEKELLVEIVKNLRKITK